MCLRFVKEMIYFCFTKDFVFSLLISKYIKIQYLKYDKKYKLNQRSQTRLFATLHYGILKSKITEKSHQLLKLMLSAS